ncbi:HAD-IA family hydrolase [Pseudonocardia sediminis]|uniref:HAD-IA family hydrolase n=1 Tax=Pseudonocardia sediminis TaxID=1397368 RepID=UPI001A91AB81|nr:HAD-IA family hydrolase [Pseudonocardia sediminis]
MPEQETPSGLIVDYGGVLDEGPLVLEYARRARAAGIRTAVFSGGHAVPDECHEVFDLVLLGAVRGARKPSPESFAAAAAELGVPPERCVVVDDIPVNVRGAAAAGAIGVHHDDAYTTLAELETLLGVPADPA